MTKKITYSARPHQNYIFGTQAAGWIPGKDAPVQSLAVWIKELNGWAAGEVVAFKKDPCSGLNGKDRAGHGLMDYGVPRGVFVRHGQ